MALKQHIIGLTPIADPVNPGRALFSLPYEPLESWPVQFFVDGNKFDANRGLQRLGSQCAADDWVIGRSVEAVFWTRVDNLGFPLDSGTTPDPDGGDDTLDPDDLTPDPPDIGVFWPEWSTGIAVPGYDPAVVHSPDCYGNRPVCIAALQQRLQTAGQGLDGVLNGSF